MATRSNSNKGVSPNSTNGSSISTGRNPGGMVKGLAKGVTYGEGEKLKQQANLFGMPNAPSSNVQPTKRPSPNIDVFSETEFSNEPVTSGLPFGAGASPTGSVEDDPDMLLRAIYAVYPDPMLLKYLRGQGGV